MTFLRCTGILCDLPTVVHVSPHDLPYISSTGLGQHSFRKGNILYIPHAQRLAGRRSTARSEYQSHLQDGHVGGLESH